MESDHARRTQSEEGNDAGWEKRPNPHRRPAERERRRQIRRPSEYERRQPEGAAEAAERQGDSHSDILRWRSPKRSVVRTDAVCDLLSQSWRYGKFECPICSRKWVATYCLCPDTLECPDCGYMAEIATSRVLDDDDGEDDD